MLESIINRNQTKAGFSTNILAFYSLILLMVLRILGLVNSIDFLINTGKNKFLMLIIGWLSWIIAGIFPIIADLVTDIYIKEIVIFINSLAFSLGVFFIFASIVSYFYELSIKFIISTCILLIFFPIVVSIIFNFIFVKTLAVILGFGSFGVILMILRKNKSKMKNLIGKSFKWFSLGIISFIGYLIISGILIITVNDYSYGLFNSSNDFAVMVNYTLAVYLTILVLIIFIHFERSIINYEMQSLKDNYSHDLGNILQTIVAALGLIEFNKTIEPKEKNYLNIIREKSEDVSKLIKEIRRL